MIVDTALPCNDNRYSLPINPVPMRLYCPFGCVVFGGFGFGFGFGSDSSDFEGRRTSYVLSDDDEYLLSILENVKPWMATIRS